MTSAESSLVPGINGFVEMNRKPKHQGPGPTAKTQARRAKLRDMLCSRLLKQYGQDPRVAAVVYTEVDKVVTSGKMSQEDLNKLDAKIARIAKEGVNVSKPLNMNSSAPERLVTPHSAPAQSQRDWSQVTKFKANFHKIEQERAIDLKHRQVDLLRSQLNHQMLEREAKKKRETLADKEFAQRERELLELWKEEEAQKEMMRMEKVSHEKLVRDQQMQDLKNRRKRDEQLKELEDQQQINKIKEEEEEARRQAQRELEKKQHMVAVMVQQNERQKAIKAAVRQQEEDDEMRLNLVWKEMLDQQELDRENFLKKTYDKQQKLMELGAFAQATMAEKAKQDERNMLRWQKLYNEKVEREDKAKELNKQQMRDEQKRVLGEQISDRLRKQGEEAEDEVKQAELWRQSAQWAEDKEQQLRQQRRARAIQHQFEVLQQIDDNSRRIPIQSDLMTDKERALNTELIANVDGGHFPSSGILG